MNLFFAIDGEPFANESTVCTEVDSASIIFISGYYAGIRDFTVPQGKGETLLTIIFINKAFFIARRI